MGVVHVPHTNHVGEELRGREERGPLTWRGLCSPLSTAHRRRGQMLCMHKAGCTVDFNVECKKTQSALQSALQSTLNNVGIQTVDVKFE